MKKYLLILGFFCSSNCMATFSIEDTNLTDYRIKYNALQSPENADNLLKQNESFPQFLEESKKIITSAGLEKYIGYRLIHKHHSLSENEVMNEEYTLYQDVPSLATFPNDVSLAKKKNSAPSSWIFSDSEITPFEFSADKKVHKGINKLNQTPNILSDLQNLIKDYKLQSLISVAILKRKKLPLNSEESYLEQSFKNLSIVQALSITSTENLISTSWSFDKPIQSGCQTYCSSWYRSDASNGYSHETEHDQNHG